MALDDVLPKGWKIWCRKRMKGRASVFDVWLLEFNDEIVWSATTRLKCKLYLDDLLVKRRSNERQARRDNERTDQGKGQPRNR
jgi:hypothetical protein